MLDQRTGERYFAQSAEEAFRAASAANAAAEATPADSTIHDRLAAMDQAYRDAIGLPERDDAAYLRSLTELNQALTALHAPVEPLPTLPAPPISQPRQPEPAVAKNDPFDGLPQDTSDSLRGYLVRLELAAEIRDATARVERTKTCLAALRESDTALRHSHQDFRDAMSDLYGANAEAAINAYGDLFRSKGAVAADESLRRDPASLGRLRTTDRGHRAPVSTTASAAADAAMNARTAAADHHAALARARDTLNAPLTARAPDLIRQAHADLSAATREHERLQQRVRQLGASSTQATAAAHFRRLDPATQAMLIARIPQLRSLLATASSVRRTIDGPEPPSRGLSR